MLERFKSMEGQTFLTLARGSKFEVLDVTQKDILIHVFSTDKERVLFQKEIETAWEALTRLGVLKQTEILAQGSRSSAYIAKLFSELPGVSYTLHPITMRYQSS